MTVITLYPNGITSGNPPPPHERKPPEKQEGLSGWSYKASARLRKWLYSIECDQLTGQGYAITLTTKNCPETPSEYAKIIDNYFKRLMRKGCLRYNWIIEWQSRGVPHIHAIAYFPELNRDLERSLVDSWLTLTDHLISSHNAQHIAQISNQLGWLKYLSKHAARGYTHYQRSNDNIPKQWKNKTGRMWGKSRNWPETKPIQYELSQEAHYRYRRIMKNHTHAHIREGLRRALAEQHAASRVLDKALAARSFVIEKRKLSAFRKRKKSDTNKITSQVNGTTNWLDHHHSSRIITYLARNGYQVIDRSTGEVLEG